MPNKLMKKNAKELDENKMVMYNKQKGRCAMSVLDGFKIFNFSEGVPYLSVTSNGITFNKAVIMKLEYPKHVVLYVDERTKRIALQARDEKVENSVAFYKQKTSNVLSVRWNGKDLLNTIKGMMEWDLEKESYRAEGELIQDERVMIFDLSRATDLN